MQKQSSEGGNNSMQYSTNPVAASNNAANNAVGHQESGYHQSSVYHSMTQAQPCDDSHNTYVLPSYGANTVQLSDDGKDAKLYALQVCGVGQFWTCIFSWLEVISSLFGWMFEPFGN